MSELSKILKIIEEAPDDFESKMPEIEKKIFKDISILVKDLKLTHNGKIETSLENLKIINDIKLKLGKIVVSKEYSKEVEEFVSNIPKISNFQTSTEGLQHDAKKMMTAVTKAQIDKTLESLIGSGYKQEVVSNLYNTLLTNVTTGGSYSDLTEQLRSQLITTEESPGLLSKHARTYVMDTLGQFAGQGNSMIADALNSEWFRYIGSNITTTREFCLHLTEKDFVHKSEIPEIIKGVIDGHECKLNQNTGLPLGMKEETTPENFIVHRGGWNCRHELIPVNEVIVPKNIRGKRSQKIVKDWADKKVKGGIEFNSSNLYSGNIKISKSNIIIAINHLTGKNKEIVIKVVENINKWEKYKENVPLKHDRKDFNKFNYYTLEIGNNKYIIHVGISVKTGEEIFYTVYNIKKT